MVFFCNLGPDTTIMGESSVAVVYHMSHFAKQKGMHDIASCTETHVSGMFRTSIARCALHFKNPACLHLNKLYTSSVPIYFCWG